MMKRISKLAATGAMLGGLAYTPQAHAVCDACVTAAVAAAAATVASTITTSGEYVAQQIAWAISGSTKTLASESVRAAELTVQGNSELHTQMERTRQDARFMVSDACATLAGTQGVAEANRNNVSLGGGVGRGGGGTRGGAGVSGDMRRALNIAGGQEAAPSPELQAKLAGTGACSSFVSSGANAVRAETCTLAGYKTGLSNGHPDADIRAETLIDGPQDGTSTANFRRKLTIDPDGSDVSAVQAFLRNLNTPIDLRQLKRGELNTDMGRQYIAYRDSYEARMSLAEKPARQMVANRIANRALIPYLQQLVESELTGPFVRTYLNAAYPQWSSRGISNDEMANLEAERRHQNREWQLLMASMPPETHVKEQTQMMAYQTVLLTRILSRLDEQSVFQGQNASSTVRQEMMPQLVQLHSAATK